MLDADDRRPFYFAVSEVVREYLGRRLAFDALELTSSELLAAMDARAEVLAVRGELAAWLAACDLVKYAGVAAARDEGLALLERAVGIVESTHAAVRAAAAPPPAALPPPPPEAARAG
jgi:hypothetical protein